MTPHFTLAELTMTSHRQFDNTPNAAELANLTRSLMSHGLYFDQIIREFDAWTHISIPNTAAQLPRRQALIIDKLGTRPFV